MRPQSVGETVNGWQRTEQRRVCVTRPSAINDERERAPNNAGPPKNGGASCSTESKQAQHIACGFSAGSAVLLFLLGPWPRLSGPAASTGPRDRSGTHPGSLLCENLPVHCSPCGQSKLARRSCQFEALLGRQEHVTHETGDVPRIGHSGPTAPAAVVFTPTVRLHTLRHVDMDISYSKKTKAQAAGRSSRNMR